MKDLRFKSMDGVSSPFSVASPHEGSNYDEFSMRQSLLFSDSLKDLKNLRKQLYSAAEYFEQSYSKDDEKQMLIETLKDYTIKALVNTVDHLGNMAYKVNNFLDEEVGEVSGIELRLSCVEQRVRTCEKFIDCAGLSQQSWVLETPKHYKRYIFPADDTMNSVRQTKSKFHSCSDSAEINLPQFKNAKAVQATSKTPSLLRNGHFVSPLSKVSSIPGNFSLTRIASKKKMEKQRVSPQRFSLVRSGSLASRSVTPNFHLIRSSSLVSRSHATNCFNAQWKYPSGAKKAISLDNLAERERSKQIEQYSRKSKRLFGGLLSTHKLKKDGTLYKYLDEN